eukprot:COSAG02_NODE_46833_length_345_cov_2.333333_1_plen_82_part_01
MYHIALQRIVHSGLYTAEHDLTTSLRRVLITIILVDLVPVLDLVPSYSKNLGINPKSPQNICLHPGFDTFLKYSPRSPPGPL